MALPLRRRLGGIVAFVDDHAHLLMLAACGLFILQFGALQILDHWGLRTQLNDLGHMEQALWSLVHGDLAMSVSDPGFASRLVSHSNLILYVIAPLYALIPSPYTLLLLATVAGAASGYLLFLLARVLTRPAIALLFGVALLLNPMMQETTLFDFHPDVLALPFFLAALIAMEKRLNVLYWIAIALLLSVKEDMPFLVLFMSPFVMKRWSVRTGALTAIAALIYASIIFLGTPALFDVPVASHALYRFGAAGGTPLEIVFGILLHPWDALQNVLTLNKPAYIFLILLQGGFFAIHAPFAALAALPNIAQNLLDVSGFQSRIAGVYYSGIVMTVLYASSVYGYVAIKTQLPRFAKAGLAYFALQAVIVTMILSPAPYSSLASWSDYSITHDRDVWERLKGQIPPDAALFAQNNLGAHFADRAVIVKLPAHLDHADYALYHIRHPHARYNPAFLMNEHMMIGNTPELYEAEVTAMFRNPNFGMVDYGSSFYLFKRGHDRSLNDEAWAEAQKDLEMLKKGPPGRMENEE